MDLKVKDEDDVGGPTADIEKVLPSLLFVGVCVCVLAKRDSKMGEVEDADTNDDEEGREDATRARTEPRCMFFVAVSMGIGVTTVKVINIMRCVTYRPVTGRVTTVFRRIS